MLVSEAVVGMAFGGEDGPRAVVVLVVKLVGMLLGKTIGIPRMALELVLSLGCCLAILLDYQLVPRMAQELVLNSTS